MSELKFTSAYTGQQVELAIQKALPLESFAHISDEVIDEQVFHILWKVAPTATNSVSGFTVDPATGKICEVSSVNQVYTIYRFISEGDVVSETEIKALFN